MDSQTGNEDAATTVWSASHLLGVVVMSALAGILILVGLCIVGNQPQIFNDYVIEYTAIDGINKTGEIRVVQIACIVCVAFLLVWEHGIRHRTGTLYSTRELLNSSNIIPFAMILHLCVGLLVYNTFSPLMAGAGVVILAALVAKRDRTADALALYFLTIYGLIGIYRLSVLLNVTTVDNTAVLIFFMILVSMVTCLSFLFIPKSTQALARCALLSMCIMPFILLVLAQNKYVHNGKLVQIDIPSRSLILVLCVIALCVYSAVHRLRAQWNRVGTQTSISELIGAPSLFIIMFVNQMGRVVAFLPFDIHHPGENIISFSQVVLLGQKLYEEYTPASGLYAMLEGGILHFFCDGELTFYSLADNLYLMLVLMVTAYLLRQQLDGLSCLFLSLVYNCTFNVSGTYNRFYWILPIMLLLAVRKLIDRPAIWLLAWLTTGLLHGLYYPLAGSAVFLGFLPLAIVQIKRLASPSAICENVLKPPVLIMGTGSLLLLIACMPIIVGMLHHTFAMASQTQLADGIGAFAVEAPEYFLPWLAHGRLETLRIAIYTSSRFTIPIALILLSTSFTYTSLQSTHTSNTISSTTTINVLRFVLPAAICLIVTSTYTIVRMDFHTLLARQTTPVMCGAILIFIYIMTSLHSNRATRLVAILVLGVPGLCGLATILSGLSISTLTNRVVVPNSYVSTQDVQNVAFGPGFANSETYKILTSDATIKSSVPDNASTFATSEQFMGHYVANIPGASTIEALTIKGFDATVECAQTLVDNNAVIGTRINPLTNYYLYNWVMTSGDYMWSKQSKLFYPSRGTAHATVSKKNSTADLNPSNRELGMVPSSTGLSLASLEPIFSDPDVSYTIYAHNGAIEVSLDGLRDGDDADFLYMELGDVDDTPDRALLRLQHTAATIGDHDWIHADDGVAPPLTKAMYNWGRSVIVRWTDDEGRLCTERANLSQGKLLFPLGSGRGWLLNSHDSLSIYVEDEYGNWSAPKIESLRFLKLREVSVDGG